MEFSPGNAIVKLCLQGMHLEDEGKSEKANGLFSQAWNLATDDFEKFITAHCIARYQTSVSGKLSWYETALQLALSLNQDSVNSALADLYSNIAGCYKALGDFDKAEKNNQLAIEFAYQPSDAGPFYHGTKADLQVGDLLTAGRSSNYHSEIIMKHIYFTAMVNGAGLAAALAKGDGREHVYIVEPTGSFENDPNVTNKKFPGNPTRSYRTREPLKIIGETIDWVRQTSEELQKFRERLAGNKGGIIN